MKRVYTGIESSGKSLQLSIEAENILRRNIKWLKATGIPRVMAFDSPMSPNFIKRINDAGLKYIQFYDLHDMLKMNECDIFINELIKYFPASGSNSLSNEQLDFLTQGAKSGVHMYCASQDFSQVHKQFRLLVNEVWIVNKVVGSRRPIKSAPSGKFIWGLCVKRSVPPSSFKGDNNTMIDKAGFSFPYPFLIYKVDCDRFDTSYKVPLSRLPDKRVRKQRIVGYNEDGTVEYEKEVWV